MIYIIEVEESFHDSEKIDYCDTLGYFTSYELAEEYLLSDLFTKRTYTTYSLVDNLSDIIEDVYYSRIDGLWTTCAHIKKLELIK